MAPRDRCNVYMEFISVDAFNPKYHVITVVDE